MKSRLLLIADDAAWRTRISRALTEAGYHVETRGDAAELTEAMPADPEIVLMSFTAIEPPQEKTIERVRELAPQALTLVLSASQPVPQGVEKRLLRAGVADIVGWTEDEAALLELVSREREASQAERQALTSYASISSRDRSVPTVEASQRSHDLQIMPEQRILIVDDLPEWRRGLSEPLRGEGYTVGTAASLDEAIRLLDANLYHLLILDLRLEDSDGANVQGLMLLDELERRLGGSEAISKIMISGYSTRQHLRSAFKKYRVFDFVIKDEYDEVELRNTVRDAFAREVRMNPHLNIVLLNDLTWRDMAQALTLEGKGVEEGDPRIPRLIVELEDLFRRLFNDFTRIVIERVKPGHGRAGVVRVIPFAEGSHDETVIVKFGDFREIDREYSCYVDFVKGKTGTRATQMLNVRRTPLLGGIVYSFIGARIERVQDLESFYQTHAVEAIDSILDDLFKDTCGNWYADRGQVQYIQLTEEYTRGLRFDPERLKAALQRTFPALADRRVLEFAELPSVQLPNPLYAVQGQTFGKPTYSCITHGDLNANNAFVDKDKHTWLIDFYWTGRGHILRDFVRLETGVKFLLLSEGDLTQRYALEHALVPMRRFRDVLSLDYAAPNPAFDKAFRTVRKIRQIAGEIVQPNDDFSEYEIALLYTTLNVQRFFDVPQVNRLHALVAAGMLCEKFGLIT